MYDMPITIMNTQPMWQPAEKERKKEGRREKRVKEKRESKRTASWEKQGLSTEVGRQ